MKLTGSLMQGGAPQIINTLRQLARRLLFNESVKSARCQPLWYHLHKWTLHAMNYGGGSYIESSGEAWVLENLRNLLGGNVPKVVFDVGANVGTYSLFACKCLPEANVYAFEPLPEAFERLRENVQDAGNIHVFNIGLSSANAAADIYSYRIAGQPNSALSSLNQRRGIQYKGIEVASAVPIQLCTLDDFCESNGISHIDLLKIDVEGHEFAVLTGADRALQHRAISAIQFEFSTSNIASKTYFCDFWELLSPTFKLFRILPGGLCEIRHYDEHLEVFLTTNYLAVLN